ncbi:MAG: hypothetical protein ACE5IR_26470, partial [bacterium]
ADAIAERYFSLAPFVRPGVFITKLRRTFAKSEMQQDIEIEVTEDRREFREVRYVNNSGFGLLGFLLLIATLFFRRRYA